MVDERFIEQVQGVEHLRRDSALLEQHGITTFSALFAVIRDENADESLRAAACSVVFGLRERVDQRRAVPALLVALRSPSHEVQRKAITALGQTQFKRAFQTLLHLVKDKTQNADVRAWALNSSSVLFTERATADLRRIIFDETDDLHVRSQTVEWSHPLPLQDYIELLKHSIADLRFWAAFRLAGLWYTQDLMPALDALDRVAAFDHAVPVVWGWHVDREAFAALEAIRFAPYRQRYVDEDGDDHEHSWGTWLISPADEYIRYSYLHREWGSDWRYTTTPEPAVSLHIEVDWLRSQLQTQWAGIQFEPKRPTQHTYTLEWALQIEGYNLIGGLHRDGYGVVVTGNYEAVFPFAIWYRSLFGEQKLYLYDWAGVGIHLQPQMTVNQIQQATQTDFETFKAEIEAIKASREPREE